MRSLLLVAVIGCAADPAPINLGQDCAVLLASTTRVETACLAVAAEGGKSNACPAVYGEEPDSCTKLDADTVEFAFAQSLNGINGLVMAASRDGLLCEFVPCQ